MEETGKILEMRDGLEMEIFGQRWKNLEKILEMGSAQRQGKIGRIWLEMGKFVRDGQR